MTQVSRNQIDACESAMSAHAVRMSRRAWITVYLIFLTSLMHLGAAIAANAVGSSFSALSPTVKAPFYLLPGMAILTMLGLGMPKPRHFPRVLYLLFLLSTSVFVTGLMVGGVKVATGATLPLYYIGDALKYFSSWGSYLAVSASAYLLCKADKQAAPERRLVQLCFILAAIEACAVVVLAARLPYWQKIHLSAIPLIGFGLLYVRAGFLMRTFALLLGASAAAWSGKRSGLATPVLASAAVFLLLVPRVVPKFATRLSIRSAHARTIAALGAVLVMGAAIIGYMGDEQARRFTLMYSSLSEFVVQKLSGSDVTDQSMNSRYAESGNVKKFYEGRPLHALLGGGFGVETPMYYETGVTSVSGRMHHVHAAWWVYFLRNGLLGVTVLALYFLAVSRIALAGIQRGSAASPWLLYMLIAQAVASYKSNIMLDSIEFTIPVLLGVTLASLRRWPRHVAHRRGTGAISFADRRNVGRPSQL